MSFDIDAYAEQHDMDIYVVEPRKLYDEHIIGVHDGMAVYAFDGVVETMMSEQEWDYEDATEWVMYNFTGVVLFDFELDGDEE